MALTWDNIDEITEILEAEGVLVVNEFEEVTLTPEFTEQIEKIAKVAEIQDSLEEAESVEDYVGTLLVPAYLGFTRAKTFTMEDLKLKIVMIHGVIFASIHKDREEWAMRLRIRGL